MKADRVAGLATVGAGVVLWLASTQIRVLGDDSIISARSFPYLLAIIFVICGAGLVLRPGESGLREVLAKVASQPAVLFAVIFCAYALTFRYVDFRVGTWLFVLATMWVLGSRRPLELILTPIIASGGTYLLFRYGFSVVLPTWN